ncbi:hypothetical protein D3C76_533320 [compost metagenome]
MVLRKVEGHRAGVLGHAVGVDELDARRQHFHGLLQHRRIDRRGAIADAAQAAEVVLGEFRMGQQHLQHGRHQHRFGDPLALDGFQRHGRLEHGQETARHTDHHPCGGVGQAGDMEHRRSHQRQRVVADRRHGHAHEHAGPQAGVRHHHALGQAGGAAGVHDHRKVVAAVARVGDGRGVGDQPFEGVHAGGSLAVAGVDQQRPVLRRGEDAFGQRQELVVDDHVAGIAVVQRIDDLRDAPAGIHRIEHRAEPPAGQYVFQITVGVQRQHADAVARLHAEAAQAGGQARHALAQLAEGVPAVLVDGGDPLGIHLHGDLQTMGQLHGKTSTVVLVEGMHPRRRSRHRHGSKE